MSYVEWDVTNGYDSSLDPDLDLKSFVILFARCSMRYPVLASNNWMPIIIKLEPNDYHSIRTTSIILIATLQWASHDYQK